MRIGAKIKRLTRMTLTPLARQARRTILPSVMPRRTHTWPCRVATVRIVGLLSSSSGLGRSARLCRQELDRSGHTTTVANVSALYASDAGLGFGPTNNSSSVADVAIYHLNPPMLLPGIIRSGMLTYLRTYNIGYWAWELEMLPGEWIAALRFVDAVMVPSSFCKRVMEQHTDKPVLVVPHPVPIGGEVAAKVVNAKFRVVSIFNFGSSFERKNPLAAIDSFKKAFGADGGAELVLKVSDGDKYPDDRHRLVAAIGDARNISLIDAVWDGVRLETFLSSADAYLSLHRSEGFGLTLAEAISVGVPVVATNWSGNTDFCHTNLCFPVDYRLVPVNDAHLSFADTAGALWAEPDVAHAAAQLRRLRNDTGGAFAAAGQLRERLRDYLQTFTYERAFAQLAETCGHRFHGTASSARVEAGR